MRALDRDWEEEVGEMQKRVRSLLMGNHVWGIVSRREPTKYTHLLALFSMSRSRFLNSSIPERLLREPHPLLVMKSTGLVVFEVVGKRRRKSNSKGLIWIFVDADCLLQFG